MSTSITSPAGKDQQIEEMMKVLWQQQEQIDQLRAALLSDRADEKDLTDESR